MTWGGGDRGSYFIHKKITTSEFVYPKKSLLFLAYPKKTSVPFSQPPKIPSVFFATQKTPGIFHKPQKITFGPKFQTHKNHWDAPHPPSLKYVSGTHGEQLLMRERGCDLKKVGRVGEALFGKLKRWEQIIPTGGGSKEKVIG